MQNNLPVLAYAEWVNVTCARSLVSIVKMRQCIQAMLANRPAGESHFSGLAPDVLRDMTFNRANPFPKMAEQLLHEHYEGLMPTMVGRVLAELNYPVTPDVLFLASHSLICHYGSERPPTVMADAEEAFLTAWKLNAQRMAVAIDKPTLDVRSEGLVADKTPRSWLFYETWSAGGIENSARNDTNLLEHSLYYWLRPSKSLYANYHELYDADYTPKMVSRNTAGMGGTFVSVGIPSQPGIIEEHLRPKGESREDWMEHGGFAPNNAKFHENARHLNVAVTIPLSVPTFDTFRPLFQNGPGRVETGPTSKRSNKETYRSPKGNVYPRMKSSFGRGRR